MNTKQKFLTVSLAGAILALALLMQAISKFGFWVLFPLSAVCIGSLCGNYLISEYKRECKHAKKNAHNARKKNSKATHGRYYNGNGSTARPQNATCKALLQTSAKNMEV